MGDKYYINGEAHEVKEPYLVEGKDFAVGEVNNDACTGVSDRIFGFDLSFACSVHDEFYRNRFEGTRKKADRIFYSLMCDRVREQAKSPAHQFLGYCVALWRYLAVYYITGWLFWRPGGDPSLYERIIAYLPDWLK